MFRLIPTRRNAGGGWMRSWMVEGSEADAVASAREFFAAEKVPVLVRYADETGVLSRSLGIFGEGRLREKRVRR